MRHFHNIVPKSGVFHTITFEGCISGVVDGFHQDIFLEKSPVEALIECLEISYRDFEDYIETGSSLKLSPNEERAIDEFMVFHRTVLNELGADRREHFESCFIYTNLNEGKSVAWFVYLEV